MPSVGGLLALARFVHTLIAARCVSEIQKGAELWKDMLVPMVTAIGGVLAGSSLLSGALGSMQLSDLNSADFGRSFNPSTMPAEDWIGLISWAVAGMAATRILMT